ncbi:MAG: exosortase E/protease, VPEID-CTERM system [Hyphomicrobiaceae bacterium]
MLPTVNMLTAPHRVRHANASGVLRTFAGLALAVAEMLAISLLFDFKTDVGRYQNPVFYALASVRWIAATLPILGILLWKERHAVFEAWRNARASHDALRALALNALLFLPLAVATLLLTRKAAAAAVAPWALLVPYVLILGATGLSIARIDIGLRSAIAIAARWRRPLAIAASVGLAMVVLAEVTVLFWPLMAPATLELTAAILRLFEPNVIVDDVARTLRVGNFRVTIHETCSGYEGLALILVFVTVYLAAFRQVLRFPAAFLLYPLGLAVIWLLNSVRIAALVSFGAHVSPSIAVKGFHSQAGWIVFLIVAAALMAVSRASLFARAPAHRAKPAGHAIAAGGSSPSRATPATPLLLPFIALMLGSIAMAAAAPRQNPAYVLKVIAVAAALFLCRKSYARWNGKVSLIALGAGIAVGAVWIATAPRTPAGHHLGLWLAHIGPLFAGIWLVIRGVATIVLVPIAEELAFRSYAYRRLISARIETVSLTRWSPLALAVSSLVFGLLHDRWLAAALSGAVFALVMLRKGRVADAIVAHAAANAVIFLWALAVANWSLL